MKTVPIQISDDPVYCTDTDNTMCAFSWGEHCALAQQLADSAEHAERLRDTVNQKYEKCRWCREKYPVDGGEW